MGVPEQQHSSLEDEKTENIWGSILSEASRSVANRLEPRTVLVLGDRNVGKSTLLAKLEGMDINEIGSGFALDYSYIDVFENPNDDEPISRLNIWQLEGEQEHQPLMQFALNSSTIQNSLAVICLDFSQPWNVGDSLLRWLTILEKHVQNVLSQMPKNVIEELRNYQIYDFQQYTEPDQVTAHTAHKSHRKKKIDESQLLPLSPGVLTHNLGIPIIIACLKTDTIVQLEKEYGFKDAHFDFIHTYIRRLCLAYGASLIYCSAKKDRNIDILWNYMKHKLYTFEFLTKPLLSEKDILFYPYGFDSQAKIKIDFDGQNLTKDADDPFESVIRIPKIVQTQYEIEDEPYVEADDDQEFLATFKEVIDREVTNPGAKSASPTVVSSNPAATPSKTDTPTSTRTPDKPHPPYTPTTPSTPADLPLNAEGHQELSKFFDSLLTNKPVTSPFTPNLANLQIPKRGTTGSPNQPVTPTTPLSAARAFTATASPYTHDDIAKKLEKLGERNKKI